MLRFIIKLIMDSVQQPLFEKKKALYKKNNVLLVAYITDTLWVRNVHGMY